MKKSLIAAAMLMAGEAQATLYINGFLATGNVATNFPIHLYDDSNYSGDVYGISFDAQLGISSNVGGIAYIQGTGATGTPNYVMGVTNVYRPVSTSSTDFIAFESNNASRTIFYYVFCSTNGGGGGAAGGVTNIIWGISNFVGEVRWGPGTNTAVNSRGGTNYVDVSVSGSGIAAETNSVDHVVLSRSAGQYFANGTLVTQTWDTVHSNENVCFNTTNSSFRFSGPGWVTIEMGNYLTNNASGGRITYFMTENGALGETFYDFDMDAVNDLKTSSIHKFYNPSTSYVWAVVFYGVGGMGTYNGAQTYNWLKASRTPNP